MAAGNWLRNYVYDRAQPYGKKPGFYALLVTQTVSGVWHGLYAGYWLFFVHSAFMIQGSRFLFKLVSTAPKCASFPFLPLPVLPSLGVYAHNPLGQLLTVAARGNGATYDRHRVMRSQ